MQAIWHCYYTASGWHGLRNASPFNVVKFIVMFVMFAHLWAGLAPSRSFWSWKACARSMSGNQNGGWFCGTSLYCRLHWFTLHAWRQTHTMYLHTVKSLCSSFTRKYKWRSNSTVVCATILGVSSPGSYTNAHVQNCMWNTIQCTFIVQCTLLQSWKFTRPLAEKKNVPINGIHNMPPRLQTTGSTYLIILYKYSLKALIFVLFSRY